MSGPGGNTTEGQSMWDKCKTKGDIHSTLMVSILGGYLTSQENMMKWRIHFHKHFPAPNFQSQSVQENCNFLEANGYLGIGKYGLLKEILGFVDERAVHEVNDAELRIKRIEDNSQPIGTNTAQVQTRGLRGRGTCLRRGVNVRRT